MRIPHFVAFRQITATVVFAALAVAMLPKPVQAFMPTAESNKMTRSEGSSSHESITREVIQEYDKDLFGLRARNKPLTQTMQDAIQAIIDGNSSVDSPFGLEFLKSSAHFDGEAFQASQERLVDYKIKVKDLVDPPHRFLLGKAKPNVNKARKILGQALHTLQDFYSHSNWVEMGNSNPYAILGVPGNPLTDPAASVRTCTDCVRNTCTDCYDPASGLTNLETPQTLTTGYYVYEQCLPFLDCTNTPEDRIKPNDFKCSHGGKVTVGPLNAATFRDSSGKGTISSGINKDTKVCRISPHSDKHLAAAEVAKKATKLYLDDLKRRLGVRKMKVLLGGGPTLAMTIDTTGSMGDVIAQVRDQAIQIVDSRLNTDDEPSQYVLVPFNDPNVGPATITDNPTEFKNAIRALTANGGGDCPEFSMTAMLQALDNLDEGDELLVFTDASSKDGSLAGAVQAQALARGVKISPIAFGSCSPIDPAYVSLAQASGGQLFQIERTEASKVTQLVNFLVRSSAVDLHNITDTAPSAKTYLVPVDSTMTRVTFSVTDATSVVIRRPDGSQAQPFDPSLQFVALTTGRIYSIPDPTPGQWSVTIDDAESFSLRVSGDSSLDFSYFRFVDAGEAGAHPGFVPANGLPRVNQTKTAIAQLTSEASTVNLDLRALDGAPIQPVVTEEIGWANDNPEEESFSIGPVRKFIGEVIVPATAFRAYATGIDANGFAYQRVISSSPKPQTISVTAPTPQDLIPGQTTNYTFVVTNFGPSGTFSVSGADNNGFLSGISPSTVTLDTNQSVNVTATLNTPAGASDKALDTLTLVAQGTEASEAFNYASVDSIVRSIENLVFDSFIATETGGDADGIIEAGGGGSIIVQLDNTGNSTISGIQATVTSTTPGVTVNSGASAFPSIGPADIGFNTTPFTFSLAANAPLGLFVDFDLVATYEGASQPLSIKFSVPVGGVAPAQIAFSTFRDGNEEIYRIKADGEELVNLTNDPTSDFSPVASPDRTKLAFVSRRDGFARVFVMNADGTNITPVTATENDLASESKVSWSPEGTKLAFVRFINFVAQVSVVNVDGSNLVTLTNSNSDNDSPVWSPDGTKIAFTRRGDFNNTIQMFNQDLFLMNADGSNQTQLTNGLTTSEPAWAPDGSVIAFVSTGARNSTFEDNVTEIRLINADGTSLRQLTNITKSVNPMWSPDGTKIVFASYRNNFNFDIYVMNADGTNQVNLTNDLSGTFNSGFPPNDLQPAWSPEGTQIAYTRSAQGSELHVMNFDGTANLTLLTSGARSPVWIRPSASAPPEKASTTTSLSLSAATSVFGEPVTLTATVTSENGTPNGAVQFFDGSVLLGSASLNNGAASLTTSTLSVGVHSLKAVYDETDDFFGSESPATTLTVNPAPSLLSLYLHGTGPVNNPPTLFLNTTAPTAANEKFKDSAPITRNNENPWKEVGTWAAAAPMTTGTFTSLSDLHLWLGLKNSDDQGTFFDLRVEAYKNNTLLTSGHSLCITGITRNPNNAKEVVVDFDPFSAATFNGTSDVLSLKVLTRVGTNADGSSCGGHSNAVGLRLYFDAVSRAARFNAQ